MVIFRQFPNKTFKYYLVLLTLTMESITIKVEEDFAEEIEKAMRPLYSTKTEFIREAIRDKIIAMRLERAQEIYKKDLEEYRRKYPRGRMKETTYEEERQAREEGWKKLCKRLSVSPE